MVRASRSESLVEINERGQGATSAESHSDLWKKGGMTGRKNGMPREGSSSSVSSDEEDDEGRTLPSSSSELVNPVCTGRNTLVGGRSSAEDSGELSTRRRRRLRFPTGVDAAATEEEAAAVAAALAVAAESAMVVGRWLRR